MELTAAPLKVLYVLDGFPTLSESYIRTEITWAVRCGVDVRVYARTRIYEGSYVSPVPVVYGDDPASLVRSWKPHLVHHHYLEGAVINAPALSGLVPVTVRGHSVDYSQDAAARVLAYPHVKRLFLFPRFAAQLTSTKVRPVTAAFDPLVYEPAADKDWRYVFRAATGKPGKDLEGFLAVAQALKGRYAFALAVSRAAPWFEYVDSLISMNRRLDYPVDLRVNVPQEDVAMLSARAGFCLRGFDPAPHPYGMPQSIAEALGSGCVCLLPECEGARAYAGDSGLYYTDVASAVRLLEQALAWTPEERAVRQQLAFGRSTLFAAPRALQPIMDAWQTVVREAA